MKTINLVVYKPGYGGHFIEFLLSLDPSTMPWVRAGSSIQDVLLSRKDHYSFKDIVKTHGHWQKHHIPFRTELSSFTSFVNSNYQIFCVAIHPFEFYRGGFLDLPKQFNVKYLHVSTSPHREHIIDSFKKRNNNFPVLRPGEDEEDQQYRKDFNPFVINFDNFIIGEETFIAEYRRINEYLNLPLHLDDALEMYRDWYVERNFKLDQLPVDHR